VTCLAAGFGVLVKGPIAIAIPALAIAGARVLEGRARSFVSAWVPAALALALLLPAAFATLPGRRPLARSDAFPLAWFCGGFLLLSVFPVKRHHYLMPLYPGAALLAVQVASHSRRAAGLALIALAATLVQARVIEPILDPGSEKRAFLESVAARVADGAIADYGGTLRGQLGAAARRRAGARRCDRCRALSRGERSAAPSSCSSIVRTSIGREPRRACTGSSNGRARSRRISSCSSRTKSD
jgi:hypothetical protein